MVGKTVSHYRIIEKLGSGGMGDVYVAENLHLRNRAALKFLPAHLSREGDAKRRFIQEAQSASALNHPNVCTIYDIDEDEDGQLFIAMALYEGRTLQEKLQEGPLLEDEAIDIACQVAEALSAAHEKGIIHRDIKPDNIFITDKGRIVVLDFGLAKLQEATMVLTQPGDTVGTVAYMSPEQARGEAVDKRTDIWSLGVVLYEMLVGHRPFRGDFPQAVVYAILNTEPGPLESEDTRIPETLAGVVHRALKKDVEERYSSVTEMADDLRAHDAGQAAVLRKVDRGGAGRGRILLVAAAALSLSILAITLWLTSDTEAFAERDWLLVTDFENLTGDALFDQSLNTAFSVSIEQSSYVNVYSRRRMLETLRRMKRKDVGHIGEELGREIALREGVRVILVPSISRTGDTYALTGSLVDVEENETLGSKIVYASGENDVLDAVDGLSREIRLDLGESLSSVSQKGKRLSQVTTSSLEALKQYSVALENHWNYNIEEARERYEAALSLDSSFTAAKASLGNLLLERFPDERQRGVKLVTEAVAHVDSLTEREKYGILAFHAAGVEQDLEKAAQYMKSALALYPDNYTARSNLGWYYQSMGRYEDALGEYKRALRINPDLTFTFLGLVHIYTNYLPNLDSAIVWCNRQIARRNEDDWLHDALGWAYLGRNKLDRAEMAFARSVELNPGETLHLYRLAHTYRLLGRYRDALVPLKRILEVDPSDLTVHYDLGVHYQLLGQEQAARQHFQTFRREAEKWIEDDPRDGSAYITLGLALTRLGRATQGWHIGRTGIRKDSTLLFEHARLLSLQGRTEEAISHLERAVDRGYRNFIWMKVNPDLQSLHGEPRFQEIIRNGLNENR